MIFDLVSVIHAIRAMDGRKPPVPSCGFAMQVRTEVLVVDISHQPMCHGPWQRTCRSSRRRANRSTERLRREQQPRRTRGTRRSTRTHMALQAFRVQISTSPASASVGCRSGTGAAAPPAAAAAQATASQCQARACRRASPWHVLSPVPGDSDLLETCAEAERPGRQPRRRARRRSEQRSAAGPGPGAGGAARIVTVASASVAAQPRPGHESWPAGECRGRGRTP